MVQNNFPVSREDHKDIFSLITVDDISYLIINLSVSPVLSVFKKSLCGKIKT